MDKRHFTVRLMVYGVLFFIGLFFVGTELVVGGEQAKGEQAKEGQTQPAPVPVESLKNDDASPRTSYLVVKVIDGDTIRVSQGGVEDTVRLIGVDTPESVDPRRPVQCFGKEASAHMALLLAGKEVILEGDESQDVRDKYGRLLAYVYLEDGTLVNKRLIEEGFAHEYTYRTPYKYQAEFIDAERDAQVAEVGLWADGACGLPNSSVTEPTQHNKTDSIPTATSTYRCDVNTYNCGDFSSQSEAQALFHFCGGPTTDVHRLDVDKDGKVCEGLH